MVNFKPTDDQELLFAAVTDRVGSFQKEVLRETSETSARDALTALHQVVDSCFFHATVSNHRRFIITLMVEALDTNPRLSEEFRKILRQMRRFLADVVRHGQEHHTFRTDVEPEAAAAALVAGIMGAEIQHYQDPEEIDLRAVLDTLVEQFAVWLAPGSAARTAGGTAW